MGREILRLVGRKHAAFLAISLVLLTYLALRADTTNAELAFGTGLVLAVWVLTGIRAYIRRDEPRGRPHAR